MLDEQKQRYSDDIVSGKIPQQMIFSQDEVNILAKTITTWCALQIQHELEAQKEDMEDLVQESFTELQGFIETWLD